MPSLFRQIIWPRPNTAISEFTVTQCPFSRKAAMRRGSKSGSTSMFLSPVHCQRGLFKAACGSRCSSTVSITNCSCPCGCIKAPMMPKGPIGIPSLLKKEGIIVWYDFLRGPTALGDVGSALKFRPRLLSAIPVPGMTIPEPKPS